MPDPLVQVRSVVIPLKAVVMNILSVTATFGMLVFIFQEGGMGLDELMNFTPEPIDPTTPVMLFCIVFGLSMDYEVLMLSRIHEEWERTGDNTLAVANGLQKTGRLITAAAAIMVLVLARKSSPQWPSSRCSVWGLRWPSSLTRPWSERWWFLPRCA